MKTKLQLLIILTISALILPVAVLSSPPSIPLLVYGDVTIDGGLAPVNTTITAEIDDIEVANTTVIIRGRYSINVPDGQVNADKIIKFKVIGTWLL